MNTQTHSRSEGQTPVTLVLSTVDTSTLDTYQPALRQKEFRFSRGDEAPSGAETRPVQSIQRVLDMVLCSLALLLLLPIFTLIALLIKLDSPGPVLFTQKRVGRDGVEFPFLKFRSMVVDAEARRHLVEEKNERNGPVFKIKNDPRVTRVGRILRRLSIDELPQLLNVLRGEMSLVGPRPALPKEVAQYTDRQRGRLAVTPGLTGLWQVSGRARLSFEESVDLDLFYIRHQSAWLNLLILWRTIPAVLKGDGAY